jgi:predicted transcriptional regulator YheO
MTQEERLDLLVQEASGISKLMGSDTEVVVHDLKKREVAYISNGEITGRDRNYRINPAVYDVINNLADGEGHLIGYASKSANGKKLRASHFMFTDDDNEPSAMICVNQDTSKTEEMIKYLEDSIRIRPVDERAEHEENELLDENYVQHITQKLVIEEIDQMKPNVVNTREGKIELIRKLKYKGVFSVRDAVPYVCKVLSISQATLYNYLRELRNKEEMEPANELRLR